MTPPPAATTTTLDGLAGELYEQVRGYPIVPPHGHVDPSLFVEPDHHSPNPAELLVVPETRASSPCPARR